MTALAEVGSFRAIVGEGGAAPAAGAGADAGYGDCTAATPWSCPGGAHDAAVVRKPGPGYGGVLCCRNR